jgi:glycosyltransferase involved in cell wall biosynthesis
MWSALELVSVVQDTGTPLDFGNVCVIIPCLDEAEAIGPCVAAIRAAGLTEIVVVDGGSRDATVSAARAAGAQVVVETRRGYGRALMAGVAATRADVLLFIDGDGSDRPEMIPDVVGPILRDEADFVMGTRLKGQRERGSLAPAQILAGHLAGLLIRLRYGVSFTDMSPFRAIRRTTLADLAMREATFGWNLEMQMRVAAAGLRVREVPVGQRQRVGGQSKVSGDWLTAAKAAAVLARTFTRLALSIQVSRA